MEKTSFNHVNALTFNDIPSAVTALTNKVEELSHLIKNTLSPPSEDKWFDLDEVINYLPDKPSRPTIYLKTSNGRIPCHKKGKKLYFLKSEIDAWLKDGRRKTIKETAQEADEFLNKKGGLNG